MCPLGTHGLVDPYKRLHLLRKYHIIRGSRLCHAVKSSYIVNSGLLFFVGSFTILLALKNIHTFFNDPHVVLLLFQILIGTLRLRHPVKMLQHLICPTVDFLHHIHKPHLTKIEQRLIQPLQVQRVKINIIHIREITGDHARLHPITEMQGHRYPLEDQFTSLILSAKNTGLYPDFQVSQDGSVPF